MRSTPSNEPVQEEVLIPPSTLRPTCCNERGTIEWIGHSRNMPTHGTLRRLLVPAKGLTKGMVNRCRSTDRTEAHDSTTPETCTVVQPPVQNNARYPDSTHRFHCVRIHEGTRWPVHQTEVVVHPVTSVATSSPVPLPHRPHTAS